jgi:hypothetical protein
VQTELKFNPLQRYKLYEKILPLGKGRPHWRRLQRIYDALRCESIEDIFERNRELSENYKHAIAEAKAEGRAEPPPPRLVQLRAEDETEPFTIEEGDLEFLYRKTRVWDDEKEGPDGTEWRVLYPIIEAIDAAWETVQKKTSKSNGETDAPSNEKAENATT